jgi:hypothetical protein
MNIRWILASLAATLVLLTVAACGGDDNSSSTSASATATATSSGDSPDDSETAKPTSTTKKTATAKTTATPEDTGEVTETPQFDDTTPEINECDLVTLDDISVAVGEAFTEAGTLSGDSCSYDGAAGTNVELTTFNLSAYGGGSEKEFFESFASIFDVEILDSPGDEAYYGDTIGLSILNGKYELDVVLTAAGGSSDRTATFAIADKALPNMP